MKEIAIFGFEKSGNIAKPWAEAGIICYCVDIQHLKGERQDGNIIYVGADIRLWIPPKGKIIFAGFSPPCTHLAVSGARWFQGKGLRALAESIELFARATELAEWSDAPYYIENPVSTISSYWRKPDFTFDPSDYAGYLDNPLEDAYTKKTCFWTGGGFIMPEKKAIAPILGSRMHLLPPSKERANQRSEFPGGICRAIFEANYQSILV